MPAWLARQDDENKVGRASMTKSPIACRLVALPAQPAYTSDGGHSCPLHLCLAGIFWGALGKISISDKWSVMSGQWYVILMRN